jgi:hypothetical protein
MMTLKNLKNVALLSLIASIAAACDVTQDLGETATSGESQSDSAAESSSGTTGGADTGVLDTGPWDDSGNTTKDGTSTGAVDTGVLDTGPWDDTGDETGELDMCAGSAPMLEWDPAGLGQDALGFESTFAGVGSCEAILGEVLNLPEGRGDGGTEVTLALSCVLSGTRDGTDFIDEEISIDVRFQSLADVGALLPSFAESVRARFVVESPGFGQGGSRYVVLEQPMLPNDGDAPVLIATDAARVAPIAPSYDSWYVGSWFGGPSIAPIDALCSTGKAPQCGFDVALQAGWLERDPGAVHGGQAGSMFGPTEEGTYDIYVGTAWQAPESFKCGEDFPSSRYSFVALGATAS